MIEENDATEHRADDFNETPWPEDVKIFWDLARDNLVPYEVAVRITKLRLKSFGITYGADA